MILGCSRGAETGRNLAFPHGGPRPLKTYCFIFDIHTYKYEQD
jgi:hypothetical protein